VRTDFVIYFLFVARSSAKFRSADGAYKRVLNPFNAPSKGLTAPSIIHSLPRPSTVLFFFCKTLDFVRIDRTSSCAVTKRTGLLHRPLSTALRSRTSNTHKFRFYICTRAWWNTPVVVIIITIGEPDNCRYYAMRAFECVTRSIPPLATVMYLVHPNVTTARKRWTFLDKSRHPVRTKENVRTTAEIRTRSRRDVVVGASRAEVRDKRSRRRRWSAKQKTGSERVDTLLFGTLPPDI